MTTVRVGLCGSSLYMAALAASLKQQPDVEVVPVEARDPAVLQCLDEVAPAAIAFDLLEVPSDLALALLRDRPGLLLIGVDPIRDELLVLSGYAAHAVTAADLMRVIVESSADCLKTRPSEQQFPNETS